jgi:hypothetical protein
MRLQVAGGTFEGKQVVAAKALAETHRPQIISRSPVDPATDRAGFYGLGWNVSYDDDGRVRLGHSGGFDLGAATAVALVPAERLGIVVLTNAAPIGVPEAVCASFVDLVLKGKIEKDWLEMFRPIFAALAQPAYGTATDYAKPTVPKTPPSALETYVGRYENEYFGDLEVLERDGTLLLRIGPNQKPFALKHWNRDVFVYQPDGEMAAGPSGVTFWVGPGRKAARVVIENLDVEGQGTFTRVASTE